MELLHEAGEALLMTVSLTAQMQHTAIEALLNMGSIVTESVPIGFAQHGICDSGNAARSRQISPDIKPSDWVEVHAGVLAQSIACSLSTAAK